MHLRLSTVFSAACIALCLQAPFLFAGGPTIVGGPAVGDRPAFGIDGKPATWNPSRMPISYRVDPGPMSVNPSGSTIIDHAAGLQRLQSMFTVWQGVSTATVSFTNAGALLPSGAYTGGDVKSVQQYNAVMGSCAAGTQNPVIFDADGSLMKSLGLPAEVIGFNSGCAVDATTGYIANSAIVLNGKFQDKIGQSDNLELSVHEFDEAMIHEIGHFLGLDHSQINLDVLLQNVFPCDTNELAGLPLMFPVILCQAREDAGLPVLAPDDRSWISALYPNSSTVNNYGTISGTIYFGDGTSPFQGANVIARQVDDPNTSEDESRHYAVSVVSGYLFTANPGQSVTASLSPAYENNTGGSRTGSRQQALIGYYEMSLPPGTYTIEVESVYDAFGSGSSLGPLSPPAALNVPEFWNMNESAYDPLLQRDTVVVHAGDKLNDLDIILNYSPPTFDDSEDGGAVLIPPAPAITDGGIQA